MSLTHFKAVHQILPSFSAHDAIGNETALMQQLLRQRGLSSDIYSEMGAGKPFDQLFDLDLSRTALLYHFSVGSAIPGRIAPLPLPRLVRYHSITPPWFFNSLGELGAQQATSLGRRQIPMVGVLADAILAASDYNAREINPYALKPATVMPLLRDYEALVHGGVEPLPGLRSSGKAILLFVGRIAPNKCQQDLLVLLHLAKKHITESLQLVLVGGFFSTDFYQQFVGLAEQLGLKVATSFADETADVVTPTGVSDQMLGQLYRQARVFVSMSEHEGFGVPLVEAMHFDLPILAHDAGAVAETLGGAGVLVNKQNWPATVAALRALLVSEPLRQERIQAMRQRRLKLGLVQTMAAFNRWLDSL